MMLEWNCSRLVTTVASTAVPIAPPRLRSMLLMPDAAAASCGAVSPVVTEVSGVSTMAWPMARTMFGNPELVAGIVGRHRRVHEAAIGEDQQAGEGDIAGVEALHQLRHQRNQEQLRQAGPGQHLADLLGIVALRLAEIGRQDIDRSEQREAQQRHRNGAEAEIALLQQPQPDQRLFDRQFDPDEQRQADQRDRPPGAG